MVNRQGITTRKSLAVLAFVIRDILDHSSYFGSSGLSVREKIMAYVLGIGGSHLPDATKLYHLTWTTRKLLRSLKFNAPEKPDWSGTLAGVS